MKIGTIIVHPKLGLLELITAASAQAVGVDGYEHTLAGIDLETAWPASLNEQLRYWQHRCLHAEGADVPPIVEAGADTAGACATEAVPEGLPRDIAKPLDPRAQCHVSTIARDEVYPGAAADCSRPYWRNNASAVHGHHAVACAVAEAATTATSPAAKAYLDIERCTNYDVGTIRGTDGQLYRRVGTERDQAARSDVDVEAAAAAQGFGLVPPAEDAGPAVIVLREHGPLGALGIPSVVVDTLGVPPGALPRGRYVYAGD